MLITWDSEARACYIYLSRAKITDPTPSVKHSVTLVPDEISLDFNKHSQLVGIELRDVDKPVVVSL